MRPGSAGRLWRFARQPPYELWPSGRRDPLRKLVGQGIGNLATRYRYSPICDGFYAAVTRESLIPSFTSFLIADSPSR